MNSSCLTGTISDHSQWTLSSLPFTVRATSKLTGQKSGPGFWVPGHNGTIYRWVGEQAEAEVLNGMPSLYFWLICSLSPNIKAAILLFCNDPNGISPIPDLNPKHTDFSGLAGGSVGPIPLTPQRRASFRKHLQSLNNTFSSHSKMSPDPGLGLTFWSPCHLHFFSLTPHLLCGSCYHGNLGFQWTFYALCWRLPPSCVK